MSKLLKIAEVASILRVDGSTVRRWIRDDAIHQDEVVSLPQAPASKRSSFRVKEEALARLGCSLVEKKSL